MELVKTIKTLLTLNLVLDEDEREELEWIITSSLPYNLVIQGHFTTQQWYYAVHRTIRQYRYHL
jgi:hypothetical protein